MRDDEFFLFRKEMQGVKRVKSDRADTGSPPKDLFRLKQRREHAQTLEQALHVDGLSDLFVIDVGAEDELHWGRDGVQESQMRKLRHGHIPFEGSIDLHGMTIEKARQTIWAFIAEAVRFEVRCVRITHGKAARLDGRRPMLKSHVNTWLRQHPEVLAFTSCLPKHGGTGSVYVLLRRHMLEGRDE